MLILYLYLRNPLYIFEEASVFLIQFVQLIDRTGLLSGISKNIYILPQSYIFIEIKLVAHDSLSKIKKLLLSIMEQWEQFYSWY